MYHAADLHLDSPLKGVAKLEDKGLPANPTRAAFENLIDHCLADGAALLLIAGDLFDGSWREANSAAFLIRQLMRLETTRVVMIEGNHDAENRMMQHLGLPSHVTLLPRAAPDTVVFDDLQVAVHGQSFPERAVKENLALAYPVAVPGMFNIGVLHTNLGGSAEHDHYAPCKARDLVAKRYQYWALGHVHSRGEPVSLDPFIGFSGNIQGLHRRETGPRGCLRFKVKGTELVAAPEFVRLDVVSFEKESVDVSSCESIDDVRDLIREEASTWAADTSRFTSMTLLHLTLKGSTPLHGALAADQHLLREMVELDLHVFGSLALESLHVRTRLPGEVVELPGEFLRTLEAELAEGEDLELDRVLSRLRNDVMWEDDELEAVVGIAKDHTVAVLEELLTAP